MAKATTSERIRRLIALLGRLQKGARIPLDELAAQVGATSAELAQDLMTLSFCGVAPYDPYASVPVMVEDDMVVVFGEMPAPIDVVRLSTAEASALASALQAAGFTAADQLTSKLLTAVSAGFNAEDLEHAVRSTIESHSDATYQTLALAADEWQVVRIGHTGTGSDEVTVREIEPVALFTERSAWYVTAWCRMAEGWRTFRLDRIRNAEATGEEFRIREVPQTKGAFDPTSLPTAMLRFAAGQAFIEREWPGGKVTRTDDDGSTIAEVPYAGTAWIARHVAARLGAVEVLEPSEVREAVRELAASKPGLSA